MDNHKERQVAIGVIRNVVLDANGKIGKLRIYQMKNF